MVHVCYLLTHVLSPDLHEKIHALLEVQSIHSLETFQLSMRTTYRSRTESNMFFWLENMETITSGKKIIQNKDIHRELREKHQSDCGFGGTNV